MNLFVLGDDPFERYFDARPESESPVVVFFVEADESGVVRRQSRPDMPMDPVARIDSIRPGHAAEPWTLEQLVPLGWEAVRRWRRARGPLGLQGHFGDAVAALDPAWPMPPDVMERAGKRDGAWSSSLAVAFVKWALHPRTRGHSNPFEPLIEVMEHGGFARREHTGFLEIYAPDGRRAGLSLHGNPAPESQDV